jgi:hypothetical protein
VGGDGDNVNTGAAWVFIRNNGVWTQQGSKLVGTGAVGKAHQGISVALSADGNTAISGGESDDSGVGAAWVFVQPPVPTLHLYTDPAGRLACPGHLHRSATYIQHSAHIPAARDGLFKLVRALPDTLRYENHVILAEHRGLLGHATCRGGDARFRRKLPPTRTCCGVAD